MTQITGYREDIDGLRAFAVMSVVLFHAGVGRVSGGFLGVDIFFVISGYLITGMIKRDVELGRFSFIEFYTRRGRRLFPALIATLLLTTVAAALLLSLPMMAGFGGSLVASTLSLSNFYFWLGSGYFDAAAVEKPLLHTWSLSVEEQFYFIWPAFLILIFRFRLAWFWVAIAGIISFVSVLAWAGSTTTTFFLTPFRVYQFSVGALLVWIPPIRANIFREVCLASGIFMLVAAVTMFHHVTNPALAGMVAAIGTAIVLWTGEARFVGFLLRNRLATYLGRISYSIYLVHWPVVVFAAYLLQHEFLRKEKALLVAAAIVFGAVLSHAVEQPFRYASAHAASSSRYWTTFAAAAAVIVLLGYSSTTTGWPWRLGERGHFLAELQTDPEKARLVGYGGDGCDPNGCTTRRAAKPDLIVIGDSHSRQYYAGFMKQLPAINVQFFEFSSCPFYSPTYTRDFRTHPDPVVYDSGCRKTRAAAFQAIRSNRVPVVVGQYWDVYPMIDEDAGEEFTPTTIEDFANYVSMELAALKRELDIPQLFVIGNVPTMGSAGEPLDCMGRTFVTMTACSREAIDHEIIARRRAINDLIGARLDGIAQFLDPFQVLCTDKECLMIADGLPLYSDHTHLSAWGAMYVTAKFAAPIIAAVK